MPDLDFERGMTMDAEKEILVAWLQRMLAAMEKSLEKNDFDTLLNDAEEIVEKLRYEEQM